MTSCVGGGKHRRRLSTAQGHTAKAQETHGVSERSYNIRKEWKEDNGAVTGPAAVEYGT